MITAPGAGSGIGNSRSAITPGRSVTAARTMLMHQNPHARSATGGRWRRQPRDGFDIVCNGAGMDLQADHQRRIGSESQVADPSPCAWRSRRASLQFDEQAIVFDPRAVGADRVALVPERAAGADVELPAVPG